MNVPLFVPLNILISARMLPFLCWVIHLIKSLHEKFFPPIQNAFAFNNTLCP